MSTMGGASSKEGRILKRSFQGHQMLAGTMVMALPQRAIRDPVTKMPAQLYCSSTSNERANLLRSFA